MQVRQDSLESSVQPRWKGGGVLLVDMDQIRRARLADLVTLLLQARGRPWLGELFSRKDKNDIPAFVRDGHSIGE